MFPCHPLQLPFGFYPNCYPSSGATTKNLISQQPPSSLKAIHRFGLPQSSWITNDLLQQNTLRSSVYSLLKHYIITVSLKRLGFMQHQRSDVVLIRITNDILTADSSECSVLVLLSAAVDTVFCFITPLQQFWQAEPLSECIVVPNTFFVFIGDHSSQYCALNCGIPQGSILGPVFLCVWPLCHIRQGDNITFHCYADDMQL